MHVYVCTHMLVCVCVCTCLFFLNTHLYYLVGHLSMTVWTHAVLGVLYACVLYFCICTCSAQLSMFDMERHSRKKFIIIINTRRKG